MKGNFVNAFYHAKSLFLKDSYWQFNKIIEIENKYKVKSTYFILNESYPFKIFDIKSWALSVGYYNIKNKRLVKILKYLDTNGWEIGVHGSYLSYNKLSLLKKEKEDLENIIGHNIDGIRQHFLNMDKETWFLQKEAGFKYDSSFGNKAQAGFQDNKYHLFTPIGMTDFHVVPLIIMDSRLMNEPDPWYRVLEIIDEAVLNNACLVLNWHQRVFNENEFPAYSNLYIRIIEECKKRKATFSTIGEYVDQHSYLYQ
jgi:peptidoglycan/xylan/chitin deacetylase (PgdA/CDA1 family)